MGYVTHLPGVGLPGPVIAAALAAAFLASTMLLGRAVPGPQIAATAAVGGLITGLINLLVLGSLLADQPQEAPVLALWVTGWLALSSVVALLAALLGARMLASLDLTAGPQLWLSRFARLTVLSIILLLPIGGIVTSTETGMAVPDWPTSFEANMFLFPLSKMTGGIYLEHAHRLFGALVGLTTLTLTGLTLAVDRRGWVRILAVLALILVIAQGVMGGLRVNLDSGPLRLLHGLTAQIFFAYMVAFAAFVSLRWRTAPPQSPTIGAGVIRGLSAALVVCLFIQIAFGAAVRHFDLNMHALISHLSFSVVVLVLAIATGIRASRAHAEHVMLKKPGKALIHTVGLQMLLGGAALWAVLVHRESDPLIEILLATAHQVVGAILLA
ncbi:MAG: COX15/CtaA family protein, partial [Planctomycetota bacterium]|nr:COX15/CtaA family protein [Planctomycetota bacterium]